MRSVRTLTSELIPSAANLLAQAFFDNPAHVYFCPDPEARFAQLVWLLGGNLRMQSDLGASFCVVRDSNVDAMGFWTTSDAPEVGALTKIRAGILTAPLRLGLRGTRRLIEVMGELDRLRGQALGDQRYWYLNNMVVREKLRGSGLGTELLGEQLGLIRQRQRGVAFALATQRTENVTFYRRLGFEIVSEATIGRGADAFRNWIMLHPAAA
jgi:ribosomal protein S18 acetylase RimI-like enzyme